MSRLHAFRALLVSILLGFSLHAPAASAPVAKNHFEPFVPQHGHTRPVVAVVGHNAGTELTDFVIPYAVLQRSGAVDIFAVAVLPGPMTMRPALHLQPDLDIGAFDIRFPEGADYVIVPAVVKHDDAALLAWLRGQYAKGATIVSICDGALVVANTGLLKGHRATAHWATEKYRRKTYPDTTWVANTRYVVDGRLASSAGISASIPTSLALLEAIVGHDRAIQVGVQFGVTTWTATHNSDAFHPHLGNLGALARVAAMNKWFHRSERLGIVLQPGMDDVSLAVTADAYSRTGRSTVYAVSSAAQVRSASGLLWLPDSGFSDSAVPAAAKAPILTIAATSDRPTFDFVLASLDRRYGHSTARGVAIDFEYPWSPTGR